ncbi:trypco2 family protein [Kitasatospora sp. NPDC056184]|uniref:trypco2 family protein n=1 Tax=Kitasatospora sp. NPDC056184 TaxID=3345738 RepID=UPI0035DB4853
MIELSDVIRDLRGQLETAVADAAGQAIAFELGDIELEVSMAVERSGQAGAKVRFWVVELGGDAARGRTDTQHIKLTLRPRVAATGRRPEVSGEALPQER